MKHRVQAAMTMDDMMQDFPKEHDDEEGPMTVREMKSQQRENL